ncbi:hypothetical protein MLD38_031927 [Melastoma candidum]|nr:hypothetical protein MLD38_031927 [Melastoma candidum]
MYSKVGDIGSSERVFVNIKSARNSNIWTTLISAFAQHKNAIRAMEFFRWMLQDGWRPDQFCVSSLLSATDSLSLGEQLHTHLEASQKIFERIQEKDLVSCTSMMAAFVEHGSADRALGLYQDMVQKGMILDEISLNLMLTAITSLRSLDKGKEIHARALRLGLGAETVLHSKLVTMYSKCDSLESARKIFDLLPYKDEVSSSSLFSSYARNECAVEAMLLFKTMLVNGFSCRCLQHVIHSHGPWPTKVTGYRHADALIHY